MRIAVRVGGGALMGALFFLIVVTMMPFAVGPDLNLLARIGPAILWLGALLASLLALDRLFATDHEDGSLDLLMMGRMPLELAIAGKGLAHWLTTGLPLVIISPVLGLMLNVELKAIGAVALTLAAGTPALTFIGLIGAALSVALRRGGLLLAVLVLPLTIPVLIFGVAAANAAHRRRRAVRPPFHHSLRAQSGEPGGRTVCRGRGLALTAWNDDLRLAPDCPPLRPGTRTPAMAIIDLANPTRFLRLVDRVLPWLAAATLLAFAIGLVQAMNAPDDYQQGATVKIMYLHVPSAWLGMMGWSLMSVAALGTLVWRHPLADVAGKAAAPARRRLHVHLPRHRLALGPADLGHLLGVGRAADLDAGAAAALSRRHRALLDGGRSQPRLARGGGADAGRRAQSADHQILRRLVEHAAPAGLDLAHGRLGDRAVDPRVRC